MSKRMIVTLFLLYLALGETLFPKAQGQTQLSFTTVDVPGAVQTVLTDLGSRIPADLWNIHHD